MGFKKIKGKEIEKGMRRERDGDGRDEKILEIYI